MVATWLAQRRWLWFVALAVVLVLVASPLALQALRRPTATQAVEAFRAADLSLSPTHPMGLVEWGYAPQLAEEALAFDIWTNKDCICSIDPVGNIMSFRRKADLEQTRAYYQARGQEFSLYAKWTITAGNLLLVLPGTLPLEEVEPYAEVLAALAGSPYSLE